MFKIVLDLIKKIVLFLNGLLNLFCLISHYNFIMNFSFYSMQRLGLDFRVFIIDISNQQRFAK